MRKGRSNKINQRFGELGSFFKRPLILHPFLLGIYFIFNSFIFVAPQPSLGELLMAVLLILVIIFISNLIIIFIIGDKIKSGILLTLLLIPIIFYPQITVFIRDIAHSLARPRYILPALFIGTVILVIVIVRIRKNLLNLNFYLNIVTLLYLGYGIMQMATVIKNNNKFPHNSFEPAVSNINLNFDKFSLPNTNKLPDIYYIVMDSYTSSNSLKKYWGFNNNAFVNSLREKGFYIAGQSRTFQIGTPYSISSALNMTNEKKLFATREDFQFEMVKNNIVVKYLRSRGYDIVNLSIFDLPGKERFYSFYNEYTKYSNLQKLFMYSAVFVALNRLKYINYYPVTLDILSRLKELPAAKAGKPRFIYAHVMLPHSYYYFDRNANIIPWFKRIHSHSYIEKNKEAYLEQLIGANKMMIAVVDSILSKSENPPVIVIQGDHGFRFLENSDKHIEAHSIFNAYHFPGGCEKFLYDSISPFNTFKVIFNCYFGENLNLLTEN